MSNTTQQQEWIRRANLFESALIMMGHSDIAVRLKKIANENHEVSVEELQSLIHQVRK